MTAPRPKCVHCGAAYGRRDTQLIAVNWKAGESMPEYKGEGLCVRSHAIGEKHTQGWHEVWNGEWRKPYDPFCTLRCALEYARKAYRENR